jgi:hypothetical protein
MSIELMRKYSHIIYDHIEPLSRIAITGGEPTLHPQFFDILDIAANILRSKMKIPILILSNGVGEKVNSILSEVRKRYTTLDSPTPEISPNDFVLHMSTKKQTEQFYIVCSKNRNTSLFVSQMHKPIFRAAIDFFPKKEDFYKTCWVTGVCGYDLTPYGIFACTAAPVAISTIFKLDALRFDHFPTEEEAERQLKQLCKYCSVPCQQILSPIISPTYEKQLQEWRNDPFFLDTLEI